MAFLWTACVAWPAAGAAPESRPNVVVIMIDDLNDYVGVLGGHPQARTPNIDRLARSGVLFTRAYSNDPVCAPSRASMFTGIYPDGMEELYDHRADPHEWRNIATEPRCEDAKRELKQTLLQMLRGG